MMKLWIYPHLCLSPCVDRWKGIKYCMRNDKLWPSVDRLAALSISVVKYVANHHHHHHHHHLHHLHHHHLHHHCDVFFSFVSSVDNGFGLLGNISRYVRKVGVCMLTAARMEPRLKVFRICCDVLKKVLAQYQVKDYLNLTHLRRCRVLIF